jgi:CheY-like chemotaxis protein
MVKMRDITEFLDLGASYFVPKPIKPEMLKQYVLTLLAKTS